MTGYVIIDVLLWIMIGSLAFASICGVSVLFVLTIKAIKNIIKN